MFAGRPYGKGLAAQRDCPDIPYSLVEPSNLSTNLSLLGREIARWNDTFQEFQALASAGRLTADVVQRAEFGVDVLGIVQNNLQLGVCCLLLAVGPDDQVLGAMAYLIVPPTLLNGEMQGTIALLAVDPRNMPGSPHATQLRGVGTALVAAASQRMIAVGADVVYLHPLDAEARRFWVARGFRRCGGGGLLCVRGVDAIAALIDGCLQSPEVPADGEFLLCGLPGRVRERLNGRRATVRA